MSPMRSIGECFTLVVCCLLLRSTALASQTSVWAAWEILKSSWTGGNISLACGDDTYRIEKSIVGTISISQLRSGGNWYPIDGAEFSDTSVSFGSKHQIEGVYFYDDVLRLNSIQMQTDEFRNKATKRLAEELQKKEIIRTKQKTLAEAKLAKCEDENTKKVRPLIEQSEIVFAHDLDREDRINREVGLRVAKACTKLRNNVDRLEVGMLTTVFSKKETEPPLPKFEIEIESKDRDTSTELSFRSEQKIIRVLDWPVYKAKISLAEFTKTLEGALSPLDEIHADAQYCSILK